MRSKYYTDEQMAFVRHHAPNHTRKDLCELFNKHFGENRTLRAITVLCNKYRLPCIPAPNTGYFKKGRKAWNEGKTCEYARINALKTGFKKGHVPHTYRPIGSERICSKDGYILIKVDNNRQWKLKHWVVYEQHYGKIPKGHCIRFLDGDKTNLDPKNLICVSRAVNAIINSCTTNLKELIADSETHETVINIAKLQLLTNRVKNEISQTKNG